MSICLASLYADENNILEGNIQKQEGAKQERLGIRKDCVQPTEQTEGLYIGMHVHWYILW